MPNDHIFGSANKPLADRNVNTYQAPAIGAPPESSAGRAGALFTAGATNSTTLGLLGGSVISTVQITNPAGSGRNVYISRITGGINVALNLLSSFTGTLAIVRNGTLGSPALLTPVNTNFASSSTSLMTARSSNAASTGGTPVLSMPLAAGPFSFDEIGRFIVPPGQSYTLTVSGSLSVAGLLASTANVMWWEA